MTLAFSRRAGKEPEVSDRQQSFDSRVDRLSLERGVVGGSDQGCVAWAGQAGGTQAGVPVLAASARHKLALRPAHAAPNNGQVHGNLSTGETSGVMTGMPTIETADKTMVRTGTGPADGAIVETVIETGLETAFETGIDPLIVVLLVGSIVFPRVTIGADEEGLKYTNKTLN